MKKQNKWVDDGRTVADMNVEGMPWYNPGKKRRQDHEMNNQKGAPESAPEPLGFKETLYVTKGVLLASLAVAAVFVVVFFLFILFCSHIWLK